jgi:glycosyltransferase involved in cell wall biosynthesis
LKIARGEYIGFIDSDDAIAASYWKTLSPFINTSNFDIIEFSFKEFTSFLPDDTEPPVINKLLSSNLNPFNTGFFVWIRLYKKSVMGGLIFPKGMVFEDMFYTVHAFAKAKSSVRLNSCLVYYRKREQSITATRTSQYSHLLINLVTAVQQIIESAPNQKAIVCLLQQRTLINILKGLKITNKMERKKYFQLCWPKLSEVKQLSNNYSSSLKSKISYSLACLICRALK